MQYFPDFFVFCGLITLTTQQPYSVPSYNGGPVPRGAICEHQPYGIRNPANTVARDGYFFEQCNEGLYETCKYQIDGTPWKCGCALAEEPSGLCKAPEPTRAFDELCSPLLICKNEFVCTNLTYTDMCRCPAQSPIVSPDGKGCEGRPHGQGCSFTGQDCNPPLECTSSNICSCPAATPNLYQGRCFGKFHQEPCTTTAECATTLVCSAGTCQCTNPNTPKKIIWDNAKRECDGQPYGGPCVARDDCTTAFGCYQAKCGCSHTQTYVQTPVGRCVAIADFGAHCDPTLDPSCVNNLICNRTNFCGCPPDGDYNRAGNRCDIRPAVPFNALCGPGARCHEGLECRNQRCSCPLNRVWNAGECKTNSQLIRCDPAFIPSDCSDPVDYNWECDPIQRVCACPANTEWANWAHACKLRAGQECYYNRKPIHDLCASQRCDSITNFTGSCACPDIGGRTQIYSSQPTEGCINNYYLQKCNNTFGHFDCRPRRGPLNRYNQSRPGLVCDRDNTCTCPRQLTYSNAYCVNASLFPPELCNPRGITCKTDSSASISCMDLGLGIHICACLPKVIHLQAGAGNLVKASTTWNSATMACELKPIGDICAQGFECIGGLCAGGRCAATTRRRAGEAGTHYRVVGRLGFVVMALVILN